MNRFVLVLVAIVVLFTLTTSAQTPINNQAHEEILISFLEEQVMKLEEKIEKMSSHGTRIE